MWKKALFTSLVLAAMGPVASAYAEGPQDAPPPPVYVETQAGYGQPQAVPVEEAPVERGGRGIEYGAHLVVPIFAQSPFGDRGTLGLSPGIGLQGRVGWEFAGGFTTELNLGVMYNNVTGVDSSVTSSLTNVWVGAGARYSFLNASALVPFIGLGIAVNFWQSQLDDGFVSVMSDTEAGFAMNALAGFAYELSPELALELGVQANYAFPTASLEHSVYISPFLGGTLYY
ncbi:MAG: hypothetical protein IPK60_16620 [Sandaracinaceae bacterium]|jgi:opacity protein-like surface antigen|nr:hypothetical protein [Sandaracinaceae bacterium]